MRLSFAVAVVVSLLAVPCADAAVRIDRGHVDIGPRLVDGRLHLQVKDASRGSRSVRWLDPRGVVIDVAAAARERLPRSAALAFLGRAGSTVWLIPQVERPGIVWLGWNTQALSRRSVRGPVTWTLVGARGPGRFGVFQTESFGDLRVLFGGARRRQSVPLGTHAHGSWAFTKRGTYRLTFRMSLRDRRGRRLSDTATLMVRAR